MDSSHENLLFYTSVRWLSKGNVISRMFSLREEVRTFLEGHHKDDLCAGWANEQKFSTIHYLSVSFEILEGGHRVFLNLKRGPWC